MSSKIFSIAISVLAFCFFLPLTIQGASSDIVINEIAWMGTTVSYNDEWIELYNNADNPINLEGWVLKADDGTPEISLTGTVPAMGFYLLERTDDETVPGISADLIYKGALGNDGENLKLYDGSGNLIDEVNCSSGWPAGDNKTKQTMEKIDTNWQTSQNPGGTPKAENSKQRTENKEQKTEEVAENSSLPLGKETETGSLQSYPTGVVFSEILPSPEGPDETEEWIEIFNQNNFEVDLSNWKIKDTEGKTITYTLPEGTKISPLGFLVLSRPETKITLNNTGDGLTLIYPNGEIADSVTFGKAITGQSYNRGEDNWYWSNNQTPGTKNSVTLSETKKKTEDGPLPTEKETAAVGEKLSQSSNFLFTILIALAIASFSGIIILILKKIL